jgi:hypothetical protein
MFWRKTREAIGRFHPVHQRLTMERTASVSATPAEWEAVLDSLSQHESLVKREKWKLPPRTASVFVPLIQVLTEDAKSKGSIGVNLDLRGPHSPEKKGPSRNLPVQRPIRKVTEWFAIDPWLQVRAELKDGSVLELSVVDRVRFRKIHKVNPRGKHKTKTKSKTAQRISAKRTLAASQAPLRPAGPPPPWINIRMKPGRRAVISADAKLKTPTGGEQQIQVILLVATELFRWTPPDSARRTA